MKKHISLCISLYITTTLGNGFAYKLDIINGNMPNHVHVLHIDPRQYTIALVHAREQREPVLSITQKTKAIGGINAGFFRRGGVRNGNSIGLLKIDQEIFSDPGLQRGTLAWSTGQDACICTLKTCWQLKINNEIITVDKINQPCILEETGIFNKNYGKYIDAPINNLNVTITQNIISSLNNNKIPLNGYILSIDRQRISTIISKKLKIGAPVTLRVITHINGVQSNLFFQNTKYCVNGAGTLIKNNKICTAQEIEQEFTGAREVISFADEISANFKDMQQARWLINNRHPRTAVGITRNNTWVCVVVEGRRKNISEGMTLVELAHYLHKLGCVHAINLGGGGDSTMVVENQIKNIPSGSSINTPVHCESRPVSDAILFFEKLKV